MLIAALTHKGDIRALQNLLRWILQLGVLRQHSCLLVCDAATPLNEVEQAQAIAKEIFGEVRVIANTEPTVGWPAGPWSLFTAAAAYIEQHWPRPFLILEPDAIPLKAGWLDAIEKEYWDVKNPNPLEDEPNDVAFMGHIYDCETPGLMGRYMSGIAVYPPDTASRFPKSEQPVHWDVHGAHLMVSHGIHTNLIYHVFDGPNHQPVSEWWGKDGMLLDGKPLKVPESCVLYHRDKTQSLIPILRRQLFPSEPTKPPIRVVVPVHNGDIQLAVRHAQWLVKLSAGEKWNHPATISHDPSCNVILLNQLQALLKQCFEQVDAVVYPRPPLPIYPAVANFAWQRTAIHMSKQDAPWFWMEADSAVLRKDWLDVLQREYEACGRSFFGPVVPHMGHLQGTSIYPADAAHRMPHAMAVTDREAFDMAGKRDMVGDVADASQWLFHVWSITGSGSDRQACPVGGGSVPDLITAEEFKRWVPPSAVYFHRMKSNCLTDLLLRGEIKP